jgi:rhodanese-related sulfurtransferase
MIDTARFGLGLPGLGSLALLLLLGTSPVAVADNGGGDVPEVSTAALKALLESGESFRLVNVLPRILHDERHIPGSVNIPLGALATSRDMPGERDMLLVFYCMGKLCLYSSQAATLARQMGYTNLRIYREGLLGWQQAGLPTASSVEYPKVDVALVSAGELAARPDAFLVDIRPTNHYARGHAPASANISLEELSDRLAELPRDRPIALIDHKGKLTLTAGRFLVSRGFTGVLRLDGGFNAWVKAGLPVEQDPGAPSGELPSDG